VGGQKERASFALRLAASIQKRAQLLAERDGVSLNHFISLAVAEKIERLEGVGGEDLDGSRKHLPTG
jgi:HicB family